MGNIFLILLDFLIYSGDQGLLNKWYSNWRDLDSAHRLPVCISNINAKYLFSSLFTT